MIGLYLCNGIAISAHLTTHEKITTSIHGFWDRPGPIALAEYASSVAPKSIDCIQALKLAVLDENYQIGVRQKLERILRWLTLINKLVADKRIKITLSISGDFGSENMFFSLKHIKNFFCSDGEIKRPFELIGSLSQEEWMNHLMISNQPSGELRSIKSGLMALMINPKSQFVWFISNTDET
ncbi:hypothetical protein BCM14_0299 [Jezberella montanilacus]|uniref:Uncharacterized protein n=1 Tax=Jezberella montanilacus TaxID=323426 RepID=A0A2T0XNF6_9BURK|nr:hypothetical protein [Jezberella montanilacus]PRZ00478.1 hypothetical protein BCM14_0299 [Jezberella montanilacus]